MKKFSLNKIWDQSIHRRINVLIKLIATKKPKKNVELWSTFTSHNKWEFKFNSHAAGFNIANAGGWSLWRLFSWNLPYSELFLNFDTKWPCRKTFNLSYHKDFCDHSGFSSNFYTLIEKKNRFLNFMGSLELFFPYLSYIWKWRKIFIFDNTVIC